MKIKCPICATWLTKKSKHSYWNYKEVYTTLICGGCSKKQGHLFTVDLNPFHSNGAYSSLTMSFVHKKYYCNGNIVNYKNNRTDIFFWVHNKLSDNVFTYKKIFTFNELCDQNVDILDYNEVYWFFKKEAKRWSKLQLFS